MILVLYFCKENSICMDSRVFSFKYEEWYQIKQIIFLLFYNQMIIFIIKILNYENIIMSLFSLSIQEENHWVCAGSLKILRWQTVQRFSRKYNKNPKFFNVLMIFHDLLCFQQFQLILVKFSFVVTSRPTGISWASAVCFLSEGLKVIRRNLSNISKYQNSDIFYQKKKFLYNNVCIFLQN